MITTPVAESPDGPAYLMPLQTLDKRLPQWISFNAQYRNRAEESGHIGFKPGSDTYDLSQLRLEMAVQPSKWLRLVAESQDAAVFFNSRIPSTPSYQDRWDIRQAFVEVGSDKEGWVDAIGGRQMLSFGDERVVGPSDWLNQGRAFDVVRVDIHHPGFRTSLLASSVVIARDGVIDHHLEGNNLYGIYNTLDKLVPEGVFEQFVMWRVAPANVRLNENEGRGALNETTAGMRAAGKLKGGYDYNVEMAIQRGSLGVDSIQAWAGSWLLGHTFDGKVTPRVFLESNHASGTRTLTGKSWGTYDQVYPSAHDKLDFADQVGWRNITQVRAGARETLWRSLTFTETWESFWRASRADGLYSTAGALAVPVTAGGTGRFVGDEGDVIADYKWSKAMEIGGGYGHFFTGRFLNTSGRRSDYNYPFVFLEFYLTNVAEH